MRWYYGWNVLAVGMLFQAISFGIGIYCFTFWVAPWTEEFGVGRAEVMTVFLTLQVGMGVFSPFAGRAMDLLSIRALVIGGAVCFALALFLGGRTGALWQLNVLYGTLVVAGMVLAGPLAAQTLAARWFTRRRGLALGLSTVGTSIGGFTMPPLVTLLQTQLGWRDANDLLALLVLVAVVPLVALIVRNSPVAAGRPGEDEAEQPPTEQPDPAAGVEQPTPEPVQWTAAATLRNRGFWLTVFAFVPMTTAFGGAQQNLAPFALDLGIQAQATSLLVSLMALTMVGAKVIFGALADRWDVRGLFFCANTALLCALLWMTRAGSYGELMVICGLLGIAAGGFLPLLAAIISNRFGVASFGQVMGLVGPFTTLSALGPWLAGFLRDSTGSYATAWLCLSALLAPAVIAMALLRPNEQKPD